MELINTDAIKKEILIPVGNINLKGELVIPEKARGFVIFSHGSGSSRFSPRNNMVANFLQQNGIGTLLFDLLTAREDTIYSNRFNIDLLTERLILVTRRVIQEYKLNHLPVGYFGASTGAASALNAAARLKNTKIVKAVVSRGGRPDLARELIDQVKVPVLLIVGGNDPEVIELNKDAHENLSCIKALKIIPGATHLFEEPGKMEEVAQLSLEWFDRYF